MAEGKTYKTKDYVLRAQNNYRSKHDTLSILLPKGSKTIIKEATGKSINSYIVELVKKDMKEKYGIDIEPQSSKE